jgi:hypothetical protein
VNLGQTRLAVRERSTSEVVDLACRASFALGGGLYLRLGMFTVLPASALCVAAHFQGVTGWRLWLLAWACFTFIQGPFTIAASRLMFSSSVSVRSVLAQFLGSVLRFTFAKLAGAALLVGGGMLVVVLPLVLARALYLGEVTLVEGTGVSASYRRCIRLSAKRTGSALASWSATAGIAVGFVVSAHVLIGAVGQDLLGFGAVSELWAEGPTPLSCLGLLCAAPLVATARFLAYIDNRTRHEAWDVQVDFMRLAADLKRTA